MALRGGAGAQRAAVRALEGALRGANQQTSTVALQPLDAEVCKTSMGFEPAAFASRMRGERSRALSACGRRAHRTDLFTPTANNEPAAPRASEPEAEMRGKNKTVGATPLPPGPEGQRARPPPGYS